MTERTIPIFHPSPFSDGKPNFYPLHIIGFHIKVVSYRNSTSNHNAPSQGPYQNKLYLIEILHQTTTSGLILIDKVLLTGCLPL